MGYEVVKRRLGQSFVAVSVANVRLTSQTSQVSGRLTISLDRLVSEFVSRFGWGPAGGTYFLMCDRQTSDTATKMRMPIPHPIAAPNMTPLGVRLML